MNTAKQPLLPEPHPAPPTLPPVRGKLRMISRRTLRLQFCVAFLSGALVGSLGTAVHMQGACNDALRQRNAALERARAAEDELAETLQGIGAAIRRAGSEIEAVKAERRAAVVEACAYLEPADRRRYKACAL